MLRPRYFTLGELYAAGQKGLPLTAMKGATKLALVPSPAAVTLEVFPDGTASDASVRDSKLVYEPGLILSPGGELCFEKPLDSHAVVRLWMFGTTAYAGGAAPLKASPGTGTNPPPTDGPLMDANAPVFLHGGCEHHALLPQPRSITVPAILVPASVTPVNGEVQAGTVAPQISTTPAAGGTLKWPWDVIPLEIARRYRRLTLSAGCTQPAAGSAIIGGAQVQAIAAGISLVAVACSSVVESGRAAASIFSTFAGSVRLTLGAPADWCGPFKYVAPFGLAFWDASIRTHAYWTLDDGDPAGRYVTSYFDASMSLRNAEIAGVVSANPGGQPLHVAVTMPAADPTAVLTVDVYPLEPLGAWMTGSSALPTGVPFVSAAISATGQYVLTPPAGPYYARFTSSVPAAGTNAFAVLAAAA